MRATYEKLATDFASVLAFERIDSVFPLHWHFHPEMELVLILSGKGQCLVGNGVVDYSPGKLVLLGPNLPHCWRSTPVHPANTMNQHAVVIQFRENFSGVDCLSLKAMEPVKELLARAAHGISFGNTKTGTLIRRRIIDFPSLSPAHKMLDLLRILLDLSFETEKQELSTNINLSRCRVEDRQRINLICSHLNKQFNQEIDFSDLARMVYMEQASLCRFFKCTTGRTMTDYVNELRVNAAAQLLIDTDRSITEICFEVGFGNYSNFHRQFKKIKGVGPRILRQQFLTTDLL